MKYFENLCHKNSYFLPPELDFLLFEISPLFLVDEHEVKEIAALKPIVYVWICRCQISTCKVEPNWNTFAFNRGSIHYFEFIQILGLCHCVLS